MSCLSLLCILFMVGCSLRQQPNGVKSSMESDFSEDSAMLISPRYAQGFTVRYLADGVRLVEVCDPQKDGDEERMPIGYAFALVPRVQDF